MSKNIYNVDRASLAHAQSKPMRSGATLMRDGPSLLWMGHPYGAPLGTL